MIKLPTRTYTPPVRLAQPDTSGAPKAGSSTGSGKSGGGKSRIPTFESLFQEMLAHYMPETVSFTPLSEEELSETIRNWLRPAYEQAIESRRAQTERVNAELDADAWSRGMGQSTYLSDVKERQHENESRDVDTLESNYASTLAQQLLKAVQEQQAAQMEVDQFNAEQINHAREQAAAAARALYQAYLSGSHSSHGGGSSSGSGDGDGSASSMLRSLLSAAPESDPVDYNTAANLIARMTSAQRRKLYNNYDATYAEIRYDIIRSLGRSGFVSLMHRYPA